MSSGKRSKPISTPSTPLRVSNTLYNHHNNTEENNKNTNINIHITPRSNIKNTFLNENEQEIFNDSLMRKKSSIRGLNFNSERNLSSIEDLEPEIAELSESMVDLDFNLQHLEFLNDTLYRLNEGLGALLYGLEINAWCTDFVEAPTKESFEHSKLYNPIQSNPNSNPSPGDGSSLLSLQKSNSSVNPPAHKSNSNNNNINLQRSTYDAGFDETTVMSNDLSFVERPVEKYPPRNIHNPNKAKAPNPNTSILNTSKRNPSNLRKPINSTQSASRIPRRK